MARFFRAAREGTLTARRTSMVAAAPKRGDQLTFWDDDGGTDAAQQQPAPVPRRKRRRVRPGQLTLEAVDLSLPDPEAWLEKRGGLCVPQEAVDAEGPAFRAEIERHCKNTGRVFQDKHGWHLLNSWIVEHEKGIWAVAHKIVRAGLAPDVEDVFSELCAQCLKWATWVKPFVLVKGEKRGARFLTCVQTFGIKKYVKARPYRVDPGQFCEDYQEEAVPSKVEGVELDEVSEELALALKAMRPRERRAVRLRKLKELSLKECSRRMGVSVTEVKELIQSGLRRALMARGGAE